MEAVMKKRVAKSTRENYKISNITFILWLFDHHYKYPIIMQPTLYYMMKTNNLEDISRMTTQGKRYKSRNGIQAVYRKALRTINIDVQASISVKF